MALKNSLLDKLIDSDPMTNQEIDYPASTADSLTSLLRDLESMLNSRIGWRNINEELLEVKYSILNYGLPDFSSMPYSSKEGQKQMCDTVYHAIRDFEPRLTNPLVRISDINSAVDRTLKLEISATCLIDKHLEEVRFDSEIEPVNLCVKLSRVK